MDGNAHPDVEADQHVEGAEPDPGGVAGCACGAGMRQRH